MPASQRGPLRDLAESILQETFGKLAVEVQRDLAVSVVRQWISNHVAMLMTTSHIFWYKLSEPHDGEFQIVRVVEENTFVDQMRSSRVLEGEIPGLLYELNIRQVARCYADNGELLQLRVEPEKKYFFIELEPDQERFKSE